MKLKSNFKIENFINISPLSFIFLFLLGPSKFIIPNYALASSNSKSTTNQIFIEFSQIENLLKKNEELESLERLIQEAKYNLNSAVADRYPTLDLTASGLTQYVSGKKYTPSFNTESSQWSNSPSLVLNWDIIDPERAPTISSTRNLLAIAQNNYEIKKRDLILSARGKFLDFQRSKKEVFNGQKSLLTSKENLNDTEARFDSGLGNKLEVLEAKSQYSRDLQFLTRKIKERRVSKNELLKVLNINKDLFTEDRIIFLGYWNQKFEDSYKAALNHQLILKNITENKSFNLNQSKIASAATKPILSFTNTFTSTFTKGELNQIEVNKDYYDSSYDNTISLNINWRIFDAGKSNNLKKASLSALESEEFKYSNAIREIRTNLKNLFNELNLIKATLIYTQRELNSTKEQLEISKLRYNSGITSQREVINSQREATTALTKYNQAIYEYNILIDRLKRVTGLESDENCTQNNKIKNSKIDNLGVDFCDMKFNF